MRKKNIAAAVLAAGKASRFGSTKQLAKLGDKSLLQISIEAARGVLPWTTLVVLGHAREEVASALQGDPVFFLCNDNYADGIGSSIAAAARACDGRFDAMLLTFCDQPLITPEHLQTLTDTWSGAPEEIIASAYAGIVGPPVLFGARAFRELLNLRSDEGARSVLRNPEFDLQSVPFAAAACDIDSPRDLDSL
ncbi:MAG: nucleotidyltransferase family protein [Gammaproteobacteria bacterium]|nr:nucleotidyltransferase family protein [Gammaproteobacteria bacterium]